jgi:predicted kinase
MYDARFRNPSSFLLAGASQSGKTTFTMNLLRNIHVLFEKPECVKNVIYYYNQWQNSFEGFSKENIVKQWINKLPTTQDIEEKTMGFQRDGSIIIIDDFAQELNKNSLQIFTRVAHHTNSVVILLAQNIFCQNSVFREISLNQETLLKSHALPNSLLRGKTQVG